MKNTLSPQKADTSEKLCKLNRDNFDTEDCWFMVHEDYVSIANQKIGEKITGIVKVSKKDFNKMIRFYLKEQKLRKP